MTQPKPIRTLAKDSVTLPEPARLKLVQRWNVAAAAQREFQEYLVAMAAAVGIDGEFTYEPATGVLTPTP